MWVRTGDLTMDYGGREGHTLLVATGIICLLSEGAICGKGACLCHLIHSAHTPSLFCRHANTLFQSGPQTGERLRSLRHDDDNFVP